MPTHECARMIMCAESCDLRRHSSGDIDNRSDLLDEWYRSTVNQLLFHFRLVLQYFLLCKSFINSPFSYFDTLCSNSVSVNQMKWNSISLVSMSISWHSRSTRHYYCCSLLLLLLPFCTFQHREFLTCSKSSDCSWYWILLVDSLTTPTTTWIITRAQLCAQ